MPNHKKLKQPQKSKEQVAQEIKNKQEILRQKQLAKDHLLPAFIKHKKTAYQAGQTLEILKQLTLGQMNATWADKPYSELKLLEELTKDETAQDREFYQDILIHLQEVTVADAMKLFDVLGRLIDMYASREVMQVRVEQLPIDEMMK